MKKVLRAYKKTVSIVNETAIWMYENLGSDRIGFLMESNEKESGKYTFMGVIAGTCSVRKRWSCDN